MASTWGGTTIPAPTSCVLTPDFVGTQALVADGSMVTNSVENEWWRVNLVFSNITVDERDVIVTKAATIASTALVIGDELIGNVTPIINSVNVSRLVGGTRAYTVSCESRARVLFGNPWTVETTTVESRDYVST